MSIRSFTANLPVGALALLALCITGCATVGQVTNASAPACSSTLARQLSAILLEQGENPDTAGALAEGAVRRWQYDAPGPRPFLLSSQSGTDYALFVEPGDAQCLLRLYGRRKGFTTYTNNLTYIATRPISPCTCRK